MFFKNVQDGDVLSSSINFEFGIEGFELAPSRSEGKKIGHHHHLFVNRNSILEGVVIPSDFDHIHFGSCETTGTIKLKPGSYLLTSQFANEYASKLWRKDEHIYGDRCKVIFSSFYFEAY